MSSLSGLLGGLDANLDGAACVGRWHLFDPRGAREPDAALAERVDRARAICRTCPVLNPCRDTAANMPSRNRSGVWAGVLYDEKGRPRRAAGESR